MGRPGALYRRRGGMDAGSRKDEDGMNRMRVGLAGWVGTLVCLGALRADGPCPPSGVRGGAPRRIRPPPTGRRGAAVPGLTLRSPGQPSNWMDYPRCLGCCGPIGRNGPIGYEVYVRNGLDFPLGGNPFGARMDAGWDVAVGARTLFFNPVSDAAWTADLSVSNDFNSSRDRTSTYTLLNLRDKTTNATIPSTTVTIRDLNRTYFNLAGGRERNLWGSAQLR